MTAHRTLLEQSKQWLSVKVNWCRQSSLLSKYNSYVTSYVSKYNSYVTRKVKSVLDTIFKIKACCYHVTLFVYCTCFDIWYPTDYFSSRRSKSGKKSAVSWQVDGKTPPDNRSEADPDEVITLIGKENKELADKKKAEKSKYVQ